MSQATELLNTLTPMYDTTSENEPHIVVDNNRFVTVPEELKRIAVQYDHCIEKITFDCPRYWDEHDMSKMHVYVNYMRADGEIGSDLCMNVVVDKDDETMMHFDWEITGHLSAVNGSISFLVCVMKSTSDGEIAERHWNSELNTDCYVSEGLEAAAKIYAVQPGVIDALLTRMDTVEAKTTDEAITGYFEEFMDNHMDVVENIVDANTDEYINNNMQDDVNEYLDENVSMHISKYIGAYLDTKTIRYGDLLYPKTGWFGVLNVGVGEVWTRENILAGHMEKDPSTYCMAIEAEATEVVELQNPLRSSSLTFLEPYVVITDMNDVVLDVIDYNNVDRYTNELGLFEYNCTEDCHLYIQSELPSTSGGSYGFSDDYVMVIRSKTIDFTKVLEIDNKADKDNVKPYYLDLDTVDTTDATVGDAVINAFLAGRNIVIISSDYDEDTQKFYFPSTAVALPKNGGAMVTVNYFLGSTLKSVNLNSSAHNEAVPHEA